MKTVNPFWDIPEVYYLGSASHFTDAEAEAPIIWPPNVKSQLIGKDFDAGTDCRPKEKRVAEDEMFRQHHQLNAHEFEQTPGDSEGRGSPAFYHPQGRKELDMT